MFFLLACDWVGGLAFRESRRKMATVHPNGQFSLPFFPELAARNVTDMLLGMIVLRCLCCLFVVLLCRPRMRLEVVIVKPV